MKNDLNKGINCNVKNCVFNESGKGCNLDKVTISKGTGENHFCKSFISLEDENEYNFPLENEERFHTNNVESGEEYIDYGDVLDDIQENLEKLDNSQDD